MAEAYVTIAEAAQIKGVSPCAIHEALCSGELPAVHVFRAGTDECRLVGRWELAGWAPEMDASGGNTGSPCAWRIRRGEP